MTKKDSGIDFNYSLGTQKSGTLHILSTDDKWTNLAKRRILFAKYGEGNVIPIDLKNLTASSGVAPTNLSTFQSESSTPLTNLDTISTGKINLQNPKNLKVLNVASAFDSTGNAVLNVTVQFDAVPGATDYEVDYISSNLFPAFQTITGLSVTPMTSGQRTINATWNVISNADHYDLIATQGSTVIQAPTRFIIGAGTVTVVGVGTYTVSVTPYNTQGFAGASASTTVVVS